MALAGALPWGKLLKAGKVIEAVWDAGKAVMRWCDEVKWADDVLKRTSCSGNSFLPGTAVLLANGDAKPIEDVDVGDVVLATDPETGETAAKEVTATIVGEGDKDLVQVTVDLDGPIASHTATVVATDGHPFWVTSSDEWVDATDLEAGQWLETPTGTQVEITMIEHYTETARVLNLTVADIHTYYVMADDTPVLVHNCGGRWSVGDDYWAPTAGGNPPCGQQYAAGTGRMRQTTLPLPHSGTMSIWVGCGVVAHLSGTIPTRAVWSRWSLAMSPFQHVTAERTWCRVGHRTMPL